jgi:glycosyltransferase involved in cell wall biosynthesis
MNPRVSVLVPSFNHGRFLRACLEAVGAQTFRDWEIVLVDDGSADDSMEIAREFESERIRVFENESNVGTYGTQRRALAQARGDLIAILNSDDLWRPDKLERQVELLDRHPEASLCYTLGWTVDEEDRETRDEDVHADWPTDELQEILPLLLYENRVLASSVLFRREGLRFETSCRYSGDWVALLERSLAAPAACAAERLTLWRQHGSNTYRRSPAQALEEIRVREAIRDQSQTWFHPRLDPRAVRAGLGKNALNLAALYALFLDGGKARAVAVKAVRLHPNRQIALRRLAATFLPAKLLRKRLWPGDNTAFESRALRPEPPIEFRF